MSERRGKLPAKAEQNPRHVTPEHMDRLLVAFGFELSRERGSHRMYRHGETGERFPFPVRRPHLLVVYVRQALRLLGERPEEIEEE